MVSDMQNICVDFDGCIHSYENGWQQGKLYGTVVPGFFKWALERQIDFKVNVYSSRSSDDTLRVAMKDWIYDNYKKEYNNNNLKLYFPVKKPPSIVYIDDRGYRFNGSWEDANLRNSSLTHGTVSKTWTSETNDVFDEVFSYFIGTFLVFSKYSTPIDSYITWLDEQSKVRDIVPLKYYIMGLNRGDNGSLSSLSPKTIRRVIIDTAFILNDQLYKFENDDFEVTRFISFFGDSQITQLGEDNTYGDKLYRRFLKIKLEE